jgi:hypothetical protein
MYGEIIKLPWQATSGEMSLEYGVKPDIKLKEISNNIEIIYGPNENPAVIKQAKGLIKTAKRIFFLGFGYHNENLRVLSIPKVFDNGQKLYGTAFHSTNKEIADIKERLCDKNIKLSCLEIKNMNCSDVVREYL